MKIYLAGLSGGAADQRFKSIETTKYPLLLVSFIDKTCIHFIKPPTKEKTRVRIHQP